MIQVWLGCQGISDVGEGLLQDIVTVRRDVCMLVKPRFMGVLRSPSFAGRSRREETGLKVRQRPDALCIVRQQVPVPVRKADEVLKLRECLRKTEARDSR